MGIVEMISNVTGMIKNIFGFAEKRQELKNAPNIQAAAEAQSNANEVSRIEKNVAAGDIDQVRKDAAE